MGISFRFDPWSLVTDSRPVGRFEPFSRAPEHDGWDIPEEERLTRTEVSVRVFSAAAAYSDELLGAEGWHVNHKKIERLWREEGLQVPPT